MRTTLSFVAGFLVFCYSYSFAQPLVTSYPFTINSYDTVQTTKLPSQPTNIPITSRLTAQNGHFYINGATSNPERIRLFGTELQYTSYLLASEQARDLAKHLKKLGFNAVRINYSDYPYWPDGSLLTYPDATGSYVTNPASFAKLDTLLNEFRQQGIYAILTLHSNHSFTAADGVAQWDTVHGSSQFVHFIDTRAAQLHRQWAKALLGHTSPLSGKRYADDPTIAAIEIASGEFSLMAAWRFGYLNWKDNQNVVPNGSQTIGFNRSRRLDSLFSAYLLQKYGSEAAINTAWAGSGTPSTANLIDNGSFEQIGSSAWSFAIQNGATGDKTLFAPAIDSQFCLLMSLSKLSPNPQAFDAYLLNTSLKTGKDSLYEMSFWAKIRYVSGPTSRNITLVINDYQTGTNALSTNQMIDTTWKKYTFTFRSLTAGSQIIYLAIGNSLSDVMLDGVSVKHKQEFGLLPGEHTATATIGRMAFSSTNLLPYQRYRDMTTFYDTLQSIYFNAVQKCIRDTIKSQILINNYSPTWWGTFNDTYTNRNNDFTGGGNNIDYPHNRPNLAYTDSTWIIINNSILTDSYNYSMGINAAYSVEGKPYVLSSFLTPFMNQHQSELTPFFVAYASLQDWDGIFMGPYADNREDLDLNYSQNQNWWNIQGNGSVLSSIPAASSAFRNFKITPASESVTITHDNDDLNLWGIVNHFYHPFGAEGNLDPNIAALYKVRMSFGATKHKIASEYPYISDTATKVSGTEEIRWSQTGRWFTANSKKYQSAIGDFSNDTVVVGNLRFARHDGLHDGIAISLQSLDSSVTTSGSDLFMTIGSRSQNTGWKWTSDSLSIGNNWGTGPTLYSMPTLQFFIASDSSRVIYHPLDSNGNPMKQYYDAVKETSSNTFSITLKQSSPWYWIEQSNAFNAVHSSALGEQVTAELFPNPAVTSSTLRIGSAKPGRLKVTIYDDLGRLRMTVANGQLSSGMHELPISTDELSTGHYIVRCEYGDQIVIRSLQVTK